MNTKLANDINWVGFVDWSVRDFHGYITDSGSTYNAYLIQDEKSTLIDSVKAAYADVLISNVRGLLGKAKLDYIVCNHAEPDHSGGLPETIKAFPEAEVICNEKCRAALSLHYNTAGWKFKVVKDGETISLGVRKLVFIDTPMVHWPESMFTYCPDDEILFSMDAFGQHLATGARFDDENDLSVILRESKTYYANIVMLYGRNIEKVLDRAGGIKIKVIAPSHGVIWRKNLDVIIGAYRDWVKCRPSKKLLVIYDTMWKSTEMMANAIIEGAAESDVDARLINVRASNITVIATEVLDAAAIAFGSPTLNNSLMPQMASVLTYLKGLRPMGKAGFAFGSYGWSQGGAKDVEHYMKDMKFEILREPLQSKFVPTSQVLDECRAAGKLLAEHTLKVTGK